MPEPEPVPVPAAEGGLYLELQPELELVASAGRLQAWGPASGPEPAQTQTHSKR